VANASQTAAFTVNLQDLTNLFWADVTMIVKGIEAFVEGLPTSWAKIALDSTGCLAMLMYLQLSTQQALHKLNIIVIVLLLYSTHSNLTHDPIYQSWRLLCYVVLAAIVIWVNGSDSLSE
jgi:hypothetical protein